MLAQGTVGPLINGADGVTPNSGFRIGKLGELIVSELHGRFYEQVARGNMFSIGCGITALASTTVTLTNSSTPILGIYNPPTSGVNVVLLQLALSIAANTLTAPIPPGPFVLASSVGNTAVSTGSSPFNRKTLASSGSAVKGFPGGVALTGLTNNVVIFDGLELPNFSGLTDAGTVGASTATSNATQGAAGVVNFDGCLFVPPGGVLSLLNTTSTSTYSVAGRLLWEEVPV